MKQETLKNMPKRKVTHLKYATLKVLCNKGLPQEIYFTFTEALSDP